MHIGFYAFLIIFHGIVATILICNAVSYDREKKARKSEREREYQEWKVQLFNEEQEWRTRRSTILT